MNNGQFVTWLAAANIFHPIYEMYCIIELPEESSIL